MWRREAVEVREFYMRMAAQNAIRRGPAQEQDRLEGSRQSTPLSSVSSSLWSSALSSVPTSCPSSPLSDLSSCTLCEADAFEYATVEDKSPSDLQEYAPLNPARRVEESAPTPPGWDKYINTDLVHSEPPSSREITFSEFMDSLSDYSPTTPQSEEPTFNPEKYIRRVPHFGLLNSNQPTPAEEDPEKELKEALQYEITQPKTTTDWL
ncbi:hypothetical protein EW146_g2522 [Bondarzewia mesenterica]|uniref:Uncharacterized protein n=1 Tax=Bondarzewia mesenterica TaxID=1095465 RepID=A0A4S4M0P5_9AGAM|nr:hypothetical protein EW146_g2522 [Bondarzewia mesenterica]